MIARLILNDQATLKECRDDYTLGDVLYLNDLLDYKEECMPKTEE